MNKKIQPHALITKMKDYDEDSFNNDIIGSVGHTRYKQKSKLLPHIKTLVIMVAIVSTLTFGMYYMGIWNFFKLNHSTDGVMIVWFIGVIHTIAMGFIGFLGLIGVMILSSLYEHIYKMFK